MIAWSDVDIEHTQMADTFNSYRIISAGFIGQNSEGQMKCFGKAETLKMDSREKEDNRILNMITKGSYLARDGRF